MIDTKNTFLDEKQINNIKKGNSNFEIITPDKCNHMIKKSFKFLNNNDFNKFVIQFN